MYLCLAVQIKESVVYGLRDKRFRKDIIDKIIMVRKTMK